MGQRDRSRRPRSTGAHDVVGRFQRSGAKRPYRAGVSQESEHADRRRARTRIAGERQRRGLCAVAHPQCERVGSEDQGSLAHTGQTADLGYHPGGPLLELGAGSVRG